MKEELIALGKALQSDFENLVSQQITGWLINDSLTDADRRELAEVEAELAGFFEINAQFAALETWLSSGFIPGELPDLGLATEEWTTQARGDNLQSFRVSSSEVSSYVEKSTLNQILQPPSLVKKQENSKPFDYNEKGFPDTMKSQVSSSGYFSGEFGSPYTVKPRESSAVRISIADREAVKNLGVAKNQDDSDGVGILPVLTNQRTGETPIPENKLIHPVNLQPKNLNQPKLRSPLGLKDLANLLETETSIIDTEQVKTTTLTELRSPLGLQDLANLLETETSIIDTEQVKTTTLTELRSPLGLQDLANLLETETSIIDTEQVKTTTLTELRSPLGLKDLAKFLASDSYSSDSDTVINQQPQAIQPEIQTASTPVFPSENSGYWEGLHEETKIDWTDLIPNAIPQTDYPRFESEGVASYAANSHTDEIWEYFTTKQTTELFNQEQHQNRELQMEIEPNPARNQEIDMDLIVEAIAQEINREYRRFYGC